MDKLSGLQQGAHSMTMLFQPASIRISSRRALLLLFLVLSVLPLWASVGVAPLSQRRVVQAAATVQRMVLPPTDALAERNADAKSGVTIPVRYAVPSPVNLTPATHGTWEQVPGEIGRASCRERVSPYV